MRRAAAVVAAALVLWPAASAEAAPDAVGAWSFDEGASVAGATSAAAGRFGRALAFDGARTATIAGPPRLAAATALTVEAWVRPAALGRTAARIGGLSLRAGRGLPLNTWAHLAVSYDGATLRSYVDGALVASTHRQATPAAASVRLGGRYSGLIDELRVYDRALSAGEIAADRDTPIATAGLLTRPGAKRHRAGRAERTRLLARAL